ncbi:MAG: GNAT family N-acetyltransferase [Blastocatellia bacterium]
MSESGNESAFVSPASVSDQYSKDLLLRDGAMLRLRFLRESDRQGLKDLISRCSAESIRFRFLHAVRTLPEGTFDQLMDVDGARQVALVVTMGEGVKERIVAVGRYHGLKRRPEVAEASFLVEDAMQGRGIGTQLLDALAELARSNGITRFAADVLGDNRLMLSVFRKAGYGLSSTTSFGLTHLEFSITETELAQSRKEAQEAEAERASLRPVLAPRSIAVIGASRNAKSVGGALFHNLIRWGFPGTIHPVNLSAGLSAGQVAGVRAYAKVGEIPEAPELVFIAVPSTAVLDAARQCAAAGVRAICVITAGFAEVGRGGAAAQRELLSICRASGMRMVGPNCLGIVNGSEKIRMLGTFAPAGPPPGNISISSQSGALGLALMNEVGRLGLGLSSFVSIGNRADVSGNDLLQYWESDDTTDVILLYVESFGNPRRFARIARRVARSKPIVAVKSGRTETGARAASSHTAALASSDTAADALFAQTGIIRVGTLSEFFAVTRVLASQPIPEGNRVGILTNAGGPAILAVDAGEAAGLTIPALSEATQARLRAVLPATASANNPVDMIASAGPDHYRACLEILCEEPGLDAILVIFIPPLITPSAEVARVIGEVIEKRAENPRPIIAVFLDPDANLKAIPAGARTIPVYEFPENAVAALGAAARYGKWRAPPLGHPVPIDIDREAIDAVLEANPPGDDRRGGWLSQGDVAMLLRAAGIEIIEAAFVRSAREAAAAAADMGVPLAVKIAEPPILHKSNFGGVLVDVAPSEGAAAYQKLESRLAKHGIGLESAMLMPMAREGVEVFAGVANDPVFGPLVAFGPGGVFVELFNDVAFRILPLTDRDAADMISETRAAKLLRGFRGAPPCDIPAVERLLLSLGALAEAVPRIAEIDLNPVIVHPDGEGVSMIDARIRLLG